MYRKYRFVRGRQIYQRNGFTSMNLLAKHIVSSQEI